MIGEPEAREIRPRQALAQLRSGDPAGAFETLKGAAPRSVGGRLCAALTISAAAVVGFGDPQVAEAKAGEARRLADELGDGGAIVDAAWAQSLAAHARGDLTGQLRAQLRATHGLPELAIRVFDGHLCATDRLLYGAMPYPELIAFADSLASEADRLGARRGHAFAVTLRGQARLLSGRLDEADDDLAAGAREHQLIAAPAGEAIALQRRAEVALYRGRVGDAGALLTEALAAARDSNLPHHLLDRIYGTMISAAADPLSALAEVEEAESAFHGPAETCPACKIGLVVPAAIATARAGDLDRAARYAETAELLANVVLLQPAWYAAVHEVKGHLARAAGDTEAAARPLAQGRRRLPGLRPAARRRSLPITRRAPGRERFRNTLRARSAHDEQSRGAVMSGIRTAVDAVAMERATVHGAELEYEVKGSGDPVLLIPPGPVAGAFLPLLSEPALVERYRVIRYHRRGQAGSTRTDSPVSFATHASDAASLLGQLGAGRAHVVGHSTGAAIALQLAQDHPELVQTLTLLEPPLLAAPSAGAFLEKAGPALQAYGAGDGPAAMALFLSVVSGLDWETCRAVTDEHNPGGADRALEEADFFFGSDLPALQAWTFGPEQAASISQPVLSVLGSETERWFVDSAQLLRSWFPEIEELTLEGAGHLLQMQRPEPVADGLAGFLSRHPCGPADRPSHETQFDLLYTATASSMCGPAVSGAVLVRRRLA